MLKVCFLVGTLGRGGAERQLVYMLHALKKTDEVSLRVLCLTKGESFEKEIKALGVPLEFVGGSRFRTAKLWQIVKAIRHEQPDIIQSSHFYTNLYAAVAARLLKKQSIGAIRSNLINELEANGVFGHGHLRAPKFLIANTTFARDRAIDKGISPDKIFFLPNVVAMSEGYEKNGLNHNKGNRPVKLLFVGRFTQEKRPDRFLRVVSEVMNLCSEVKVTAQMLGDGPLLPKMKSLAKELGIGARQIDFPGEREDISDFYRNSDILLLTSDWEGTPNVLLEAMGYGIPVIATNVGGVPKIVKEDCGFQIAPDDEKAFIKTTLNLIHNESLRNELGKNGREYVKHFHSTDFLQNRLLNIYQKVLSK